MRIHPVIAIDEKDVASRCRLYGLCPVAILAEIDLISIFPDPGIIIATDDLPGLIGRIIITYQQLEIPKFLGEHRLYRLIQEFGRIVGNCYNGE